MKNFRLILLFLLQTHLANAAQFRIGVGDQFKRALSTQNVWIENSKVLQAEVLGNQVILKGLREGSSKIKTNDDYDIVYVMSAEQLSLYSKLEKALRQMLGLKISNQNDQVILTGHLQRWQDWQKLRAIALETNTIFQLRTTVESRLKEIAAIEINRTLKAQGLKELNILFGESIEARIPVKDSQLTRYQKILGSYGILVTADDDSIEQSPTIKVQITIAEVRRDYSRKLGIKWPASYDAQILNSNDSSSAPINLSAQFLEQSGAGRVLASPNLICKSGKEAEFLAGGEFPIRIINFKTQDVVWKRYGILLHVKPRADLSGRMSITLETEVSTIDTSRAVDGIPGLLTNKVSSTFDLNKPKIIALSGLLKKEDGNNREGLPSLSSIPILGSLFSSQEYKDNRTELVIFVRPEIVNEESPELTSPQHLANTPEEPHD